MKLPVFFLLLMTVHPAGAAVRTWTAVASVAKNWTLAANWAASIPPVAGDSLVFPAATGKAMQNTFPDNTVFAGLAFSSAGYTLSGSDVDLSMAGIALSHPTGTTLIDPTIRLAGAGQSLDTGGGSATLQIKAFNLNGNSVSLTGSGTVNIAGNIVNNVGTPSLTKNGPGVAILGGFNNFAGNIAVQTGTLFMDGFLAGTGSLTVAAGATLAGSDGGIVKATTVSGILAPGSTTSAVETMEFETLTFASSSSSKELRMDIQGTTATTRDFITVGTAVTLNNALLTLDFGTFVPPVGTVFTLINNSSAGAISGTFQGIAQNAQVVKDGQLLQFSYTGGTGNDFTATMINSIPSISSIADQTINEDTATSALAFSIGDGQTTPLFLTVTASSSNTTLVPNSNIVIGGAGLTANRTVTVTPAANRNGSATISLTVSDSISTVTESFVLTVNPVNDPPVVSQIADQTTGRGVATAALPFTVSDLETAAASLLVSGTSSNPTLVPNINIVFGGSGANRTVTITPAAGQSGTTTITVSVSDAASTVTMTFTLSAGLEFFTWDGGGVGNSTLTGGNWAGNLAPPVDSPESVLIFAGAVKLNPTIPSAFRMRRLMFDPTAGAFTLSGEPLDIGNEGMINEGAPRMTIGNAVSFAETATSAVQAGTGGLRFEGPLTMPSGTLTVSGPGAVTLGPAANLTVNPGQTLALGTDLVVEGQLTEQGTGAIQMSSGKALRVSNGGRATFVGSQTFPQGSRLQVEGTLEGGTLNIGPAASCNVAGSGDVTAADALHVGNGLSNGILATSLMVDGEGSSASALGTLQRSLWGSTNSSETTTQVGFSNKSSGSFAAGVKIGNKGETMVEVLSDADVTSGSLEISFETSATSTLTVDGPGSSWSIAGNGSLTALSPTPLTISHGAKFTSGSGPSTVARLVMTENAIFEGRGDFTGSLEFGQVFFNGGAGHILLPSDVNLFTLPPDKTLFLKGLTSAGGFDFARPFNIVIEPGARVKAAEIISFGGGRTFQFKEGAVISGEGPGLVGIDVKDATLELDGQGSGLGTSLLKIADTASPGAVFKIANGANATTIRMEVAAGAGQSGSVVFGEGAGFVETNNLKIGSAGGGAGTVLLQGGGQFTMRTNPRPNQIALVNQTGHLEIRDGSFLLLGQLLIRGGTLVRQNAGGVLSIPAGSSFDIESGGHADIRGDWIHDSASTVSVTGGGSEFTTTGRIAMSAGSVLNVSAGGLLRAGTGLSAFPVGADLRIQTGGICNFAGGMALNGTLGIAAGGGEVSGLIEQTGGSLTVSDAGTGIFRDAFKRTGGTFAIAAGSTARMLGNVTGTAGFEGAGTLRFEGSYEPGTGPASVAIQSNVVFAAPHILTMEIRGLTPGSQHDKLVFSGSGSPQVIWGGTLRVTLLNGFVPQAGQSFDLFDFTPAGQSGTFTDFDLPALPSGLSWDTSALTSTGSVSVTTMSPLQRWRQLHFGTPDNTGNAADAFDFDRDGLANLLEYAFGLDPKSAASAQIPEWQRVGNGMELRFTTPPGVSGITYRADHSLSLDSWDELPDTGTAPQHLWVIPLNPLVRGFVRIRITAP